MSAEQDKIRTLAERIASRLAGDAGARAGDAPAGAGDEVAQLRASLRELQQRLAHVESHVGHGEDCGPQGRPSGASGERGDARQGGDARETTAAPHQFLSSTYVSAAHPSHERFQIDEAVSELVDFFEREKVCSVEPGEKPCDHCSMCSSRGF